METNSINANETLSESAKMANKWLNDANASMMDVYKKQLNIVSGFYSNFFNSFSGENKNIWNPAKTFTDLFSNNAGMKSMFTPFGGFGLDSGFTNPFSSAFSNPFSNPLDKIFKQMTDYNQTLSSFSGQFGNENSGWSSINEKYQKTIAKEFEASKGLLNTLIDGYKKQAETSIEANKKLQEEINKQISLIVKLNQQFWSEILNTSSVAPTIEKPSKNGVANDLKSTKSSVNI